MKTKHLLPALLFTAYSTMLFAQDRLQHFPQENSLINRHQHTQIASHEFNIPLNGGVEAVDELYRHQGGPDAFMPRINPVKNVQSTDEEMYVCDSAFSYNTNGEQIRIIYTRDAAGKVLIRHDQTWNSGDGKWENKYKSIYTYDVSGNRLSALFEIWNSGSEVWLNDSKDSYTYDVSGNLLKIIYQRWSIYNWVNSDKYIYALDASGNRLSHVWQRWNTVISNWENKTRVIYTYDVSGNMLLRFNQNWDLEIGVWIDITSGSYTYDVSGNIIGALLTAWNKTTGTWKKHYKFTYTYDASDHLLAEIHEKWNTGINNWVNELRMTFTYETAGNRLSQLEQMWNTGLNDWTNSFKTDYEYNYNSQKIIAIQHEWSGVWIPITFGYIELYIFNNHLTSTNGYKVEAYYSSYSLGIEDKDVKSNGSASFCSPNPANELINVTNHYKKEASLKIYNMNGQQINEKLLGAGNNEVSVQNLTPGIYLFVMQSENSRIQNKVVVY